MYLYYVTATEQPKQPKPRKSEKEDVHAILAQNDEDFEMKCSKLFIKYEEYISKHKLNKDW